MRRQMGNQRDGRASRREMERLKEKKAFKAALSTTDEGYSIFERNLLGRSILDKSTDERGTPC